MLKRVSGYLSGVDDKVQIINSGRITLVGSSGSLPVSFSNALPEAIHEGQQKRSLELVLGGKR